MAPGRHVALVGEFAASLADGARSRTAFATVERYCMFVGYPRSGHSLVGSLLDAHPDVVLAHELDALRYVQARFRRNQLYALILRNDREFTSGGRRARTGDYQYEVPGQWQGRVRTLRVIGDKRGSRSAWRLGRHPALLGRLRGLVDVPLRIVHVVRNPYDNIATMHTRGDGAPLTKVADRYFDLCQSVAGVRRDVDPAEWHDVHHEDVVADTSGELRALCGFLGVEAPQDYLDACTSIVFGAPRRTREKAPWTDDLLASVAERQAAYPWLARYSFAD